MSKIEIQITDQELFDNRKLLDKETKEKWLIALRSGEFKKGRIYLRDMEDNYCCLGVLCELNDRPKQLHGDGGYSYDGILCNLTKTNPFYGILGDYGTFNGFIIDKHNSLAGINDNTDTFENVIEVIEKYF